MIITQKEIKAFWRLPTKNYSPVLQQIHFSVKEKMIRASDSFTLLIVKQELTKEAGYEFYRDIHLDISVCKSIKMSKFERSPHKVTNNVMMIPNEKSDRMYYRYSSGIPSGYSNLLKSMSGFMKSVRSGENITIDKYISIRKTRKVFSEIANDLWIYDFKVIAPQWKDTLKVLYHESDRYILVHRLPSSR